MAETSLKPLKAILETIRERVDYALKQLQDAEDQRSFRWKCKECGYDEAGNVIETQEAISKSGERGETKSRHGIKRDD